MKGILPLDDTICRWVVRRFNSGDGGQRVYWDHRDPFSGREAENSPSQNSFPALIRVTSSKNVSGRDKWYMLVFEFENLQNAVAFGILAQRAYAGQISRDRFALDCVQLELDAGRRTQRYFKRYPIVGATIDNAPQYMRLLAGTNDLKAYTEWLDSRDDNAYDPREYFGKWFDQCRAYADAYGPYAIMSRTKQ